MKLKDARICIECEEIFENSMICPSCTCKSNVLLSRWVKTMVDYEKELLIKKLEEHFCPEAA
jgi:hypothetical protein